jgi:hypothetical protein
VRSPPYCAPEHADLVGFLFECQVCRNGFLLLVRTRRGLLCPGCWERMGGPEPVRVRGSLAERAA